MHVVRVHGHDDFEPARQAQSELTQLMQEKQTMLMTADVRLKRRECSGALEQLREIQQIDPRDTSVLDKIEAVEKKLGTR